MKPAATLFMVLIRVSFSRFYYFYSRKKQLATAPNVI